MQTPEQLLQEHSPYLWGEARTMAARNPGTDPQDYYQEGALVLLRLAPGYSPARGSFINYIRLPVRKAMNRHAGTMGSVATCARWDRHTQTFRPQEAPEVLDIADVPLAAPDTSRAAEARELLAAMPPRLRRLAARVIMGGESLEAAAAGIGISRETARRALSIL